MNYPIRRIAVIVLEATTPFRIGTGEKNHLSDSPVLTDANDLPYIPGSSIRGVLRHAIDEAAARKILGYQGEKESDGAGSKVRISYAVVTDRTGQPVIGLLDRLDDYQQRLRPDRLPRREHVRIGPGGVAEGQAKFDEQVVPRGTRLVFEMELIDDGSLEVAWGALLEQIMQPAFRLGSGSRRGFGAFKVIRYAVQRYDLSTKSDREVYAAREFLEPAGGEYVCQDNEANYTRERIRLSFENFWLASQGYGDNESDLVPARETIVQWKEGAAKTKESHFLPASGFKGALSHRIAYHYNRIKKEALTGKENPAVKELFGSEKPKGKEEASAGRLFFEDIFMDELLTEFTQQHVSLDRFTQKAMDSALFDEKAIGQSADITLNIHYLADAFGADEAIKKAFECAVFDLKNGLLPLGSLTGRGYGAMKEKK